MITVNITIKPHLAEYIKSKYGSDKRYVLFPKKLYIYHILLDLIDKRPKDKPVDSGNIQIVLPKTRKGKDPRTYNYLNKNSIAIIERKIEDMFWAEVHELLDLNKHRHGIDYIDSAYIFVKKYFVESISIEAIIKNNYRWRELVRRKKKKRSYVFQKNVQSDIKINDF